jgi:hypothetical protein
VLLPVSIVFPCALSIDSYASAGADVEVPRPDCPDCSAPTTFWWGYWRYVREPDRCRKVFVRRVACRACGSTHALLPSFLLARRRDAAPVIGAALEHVAEGRGGARPAALAAGVPHTTARSWLRRLRRRAREMAIAFAAAAVELGGEVVVPAGEAMAAAVTAIGAAFSAATAMPGWAGTGPWCFASAVTGGSLLAANTVSPFLQLGGRRFMPPVPTTQGETWSGKNVSR